MNVVAVISTTRASPSPSSNPPLPPTSAFQTLKVLLSPQTLLQEPSSPKFQVLPFRKSRPLGRSTGNLVKKWHLGWLSFDDFKDVLEGSEVKLSDDLLVYLGYKKKKKKKKKKIVLCIGEIDVSEGISLVEKLGSRPLTFVESRTLMVATDWADDAAMGSGGSRTNYGWGPNHRRIQ